MIDEAGKLTAAKLGLDLEREKSRRYWFRRE